MVYMQHLGMAMDGLLQSLITRQQTNIGRQGTNGFDPTGPEE